LVREQLIFPKTSAALEKWSKSFFMPDNGQAFIEVAGVSHTFADGVEAIAGVTLTIPTGAFVTLVGRSGVGKSTLLRILGGLLSPTAGRVQMNGHSSDEEANSIGIVFQRDNLMPWRTVQDNVRLPLELSGMSRQDGCRN
jgi:NitT/TauT family transport system ATP-binding protein